MASCMSEYAVQVSDKTSFSNPCIPLNFTPSIQESVTCIYRSILSTSTNKPNQIMMSLKWSSQNLIITFDNDTTFKITTNSSRLFRNPKGRKSLSPNIQILWDLSTARYRPGPEPSAGFYLIILVDSHPALVLGDKEEEEQEQEQEAVGPARFVLVSRREHFSGGGSVYTTRARFSESGGAHEISIRCGGGGGAVLSVCIDKRVVMKVKKLQWNFRGNHAILLDGMVVDLMWDVHDWFYNNSSIHNHSKESSSSSSSSSSCSSSCGYAVFMFRRRSGLIDDSRLWMDHAALPQPSDITRLHFSFFICVSKNN